MKFTISSKILLTHLSAVNKVVSSKNAIAILDNFLFTLKNNILVVTGTDKENTVIARIELLESEGEGAFALNVKRILDLLKELPDQGMTFEINEETYEIHLQYQNGDYKFVGVDGNEFPQMEESGEEKFEMLIPAKEIPKSIDKTVFAAGTDTMRPIMMGILWDIKPDSIVFVASDTHKLVRYINSSVAPGIEGSFILPTKPASILSSILAKEDGDVKVAFDSKSVSFETETYTLICRFINGKYPNYNAVIPQNNPYVITVDRQLLLNAIKRVGIFATDGGLVQLQFTDNNIFIKAQDVEYSTSAEECLSCEYSGENFSMGFNKDKIIEVLNNVVVDNVLIKISDPARPGLFLPVEQKENEDLLVLLMPMMIPSL